jgi:hypothetical protein
MNARAIVFGLQNWRRLPRARVGMTLLCRNEADIIRQHIIYHLPKVDFLIVTDNGSTDGTREILAGLESGRVTIIDEPAQNIQQEQWVDRMIRMAKDRGADWVVNSDADEFWWGDFRAVAHKYRRWYTHLQAQSFRMRPCASENAAELNPITRMLWRERETDRHFRKVFLNTAQYKMIHHGNHRADMLRGGKHVLSTDRMRIYHYQWRSFEHYLRKCIGGGKAFEISGLPVGKGSYFRGVYKLWKERGEDAVREKYEREFYVTETDMGKLVRDDTIAVELSHIAVENKDSSVKGS